MLLSPPDNEAAAVTNLSNAAAANLDNGGPNKRLKSAEDVVVVVGDGCDGDINGDGSSPTARIASSADTSRIGSPADESSAPTASTSKANSNSSSSSSSSSNNNASNNNLHQCLRFLYSSLPPALASSPPPRSRSRSSGSSSSEDEPLSSCLSFRQLWTDHGFRTTMVSSPRPAVSVYLESCATPTASYVEKGKTNNDDDDDGDGNGDGDGDALKRGRDHLLICIGMHPSQPPLEAAYDATAKRIHCLLLFLKRMRTARRDDMTKAGVAEIVGPWEEGARDLLLDRLAASTEKNVEKMEDALEVELRELFDSSSRVLSRLLAELVRIDRTLRADQLLHEYHRIAYENCTFANACLRRWLSTDETDPRGTKQKYDLDQVYYKPSPPGRYLPKHERITIHFKDQNAVEPDMAKLIFSPSLTHVLTANGRFAAASAIASTGANGSTEAGKPRHPLDAVVDNMIQSTWEELLRNGYYVDRTRKESLGPELTKFYRSGLGSGQEGGNMPILLNAHFAPTYPLSLYLHGTAGAGKSSLVRNLLPALNASVSHHCDPEMLVRFVKQNLNKPFATLQLELDLRPNNNDYSVMSIIQGRRMTLAQSKPGLVLVGLEEMPSDVDGADPKQIDVGRLVSMRFAGRKGEFKDESEKGAPRNSAKRGISGDATIISIFTSNYNLEQPTLEALQRLEMFENLTVVEVAPVAGEDRTAFSLSYLMQRVNASLDASLKGKVKVVKLDIPVGEGDTRPLVRYLRMLAFYIHALVLSSNSGNANIMNVSVLFDASTSITTITNQNGEMMELKPGSFDNLYAVKPPALDQRASNTVAELQKLHPNLHNPKELSQILDFYFAETLAPAVILSHNKSLIHDLIKLLAQAENVHCISKIDPTTYKMMKSLYDTHDTPNLRDDILQIIHGNEAASVAVELVCQSTDAQLQIREIIEDTPSMTAFSTERSALHKDGLLFGVYVKEGVEITPEIKSRASLVI